MVNGAYNSSLTRSTVDGAVCMIKVTLLSGMLVRGRWSSCPEMRSHTFRLSMGGSLAAAALSSVGSTSARAENVTYQSARSMYSGLLPPHLLREETSRYECVHSNPSLPVAVFGAFKRKIIGTCTRRLWSTTDSKQKVVPRLLLLQFLHNLSNGIVREVHHCTIATRVLMKLNLSKYLFGTW